MCTPAHRPERARGASPGHAGGGASTDVPGIRRVFHATSMKIQDAILRQGEKTR